MAVQVLIRLMSIRAMTTLNNNNRRIDPNQEVPQTFKNKKLGDRVIRSLRDAQWTVHTRHRGRLTRKLTVWMPKRRANTHQCFVERAKMDKF